MVSHPLAIKGMPRRPPTGAVLDLSAKFTPSLVSAALARIWAVDGACLVPVVDVCGVVAQCPITLEPLADPVMLPDGFVYEKAAILEWLRSHDSAPCTNTRLPHKTILRLAPLRQVVEGMMANTCGTGTSCRVRLETATRKGEEHLQSPSSPDWRGEHCVPWSHALQSVSLRSANGRPQ